MTTYKTILVPIDGSANAKKALAQAAGIAASYGAGLVLVHVAQDIAPVSNFDQVSCASEYVKEHLPAEIEKEGKAFLDELAGMVPSDVAVRCVVASGSPGPVIAAEAEKAGADLIVMGNRGLGTLKGLLLGSVSTYVVSHAGCSVLIVK